MQSSMRTGDLLARLGGDEFLALLLEPLEPGHHEAAAQKIHDFLDESIEVGGRTITIGVSIGIARVAGDETRTLAEILHDADLAMYRAKSGGLGLAGHSRVIPAFNPTAFYSFGDPPAAPGKPDILRRTRAFISEDQPELLAETIDQFLAARPIG